MLPKLERPSYQIELPVSKEKGFIYPFTIKEQKNLALAEKSADPDTIVKAISDCISKCSTFDVKKLNNVDFQYAFTKIRNVSVGSELEVILKCSECEAEINAKLDFNEFKVIYPEEKPKDVVMITDSYGIKLKMPSMESLDNTDDSGISMYIESVFDQENVYPLSEYSKEEVQEFVDSLPAFVLKEIAEFKVNLPSYVLVKPWKCIKCGAEHELVVNGIVDFFI